MRPLAATAATAATAAALYLFLRRRRRYLSLPLDDDYWIAFSHAERLRRKLKPSQSGFRVTAVVVYRVSPSPLLQYVVGVNDEASNLLNSCCAERAAFLQLANIGVDAAKLEVLAVYITTDAAHALTPGALCREYMSSSAWTSMKNTRIVMEGTDLKSSRLERTLEELYPYASVYTRLDRHGQLAEGQRLKSTVNAALLTGGHKRMPGVMPGDDTRMGSDPVGDAWRGATDASRCDAKSDLHPISFGACVVFADGGKCRAWQKKALEYGCSLDAVCQLCQSIEEQSEFGMRPKVLCMADQYGVCHAPFATARAFLTEHGYGDVSVLLHDNDGVLHTVQAEDLLPKLPSWCS